MLKLTPTPPPPTIRVGRTVEEHWASLNPHTEQGAFSDGHSRGKGERKVPPKSSLCFACPAKKACSPPRDLNQIPIGHQQGKIDSVPLTELSLKAAVKGNTRFSNITSRSLIFSNFALSASYCFEISSALS